MIREIITFENYFDDFASKLNKKVLEKIEYIFDIIETQERISEKFLKHIENGLFEIRIEFQGNIYRVFCCFDEGKLVVLFNGFQKKGSKIAQKRIRKSIKNNVGLL